MPLPSDGLTISPVEMAEAILDGRKTLLVKSRPFDIAGRDWLLLSGNVAFGVLKLGDPKGIDVAEVDKLEGETLMSPEAREDVLPGRDEFWVYPITRADRFPTPRPISPLTEPKIVVRGVEFKPVSDLDAVANAELVLAQASMRSVEKRIAKAEADPRARVAGLLRVGARLVPGFVDRTLRLTSGPAGAIRTLRELPSLIANASGALRRVGVRPAPVDAPPGSPALLRLLARQLPEAIKQQTERDKGVLKRALDSLLDSVEEILSFDFTRLEDTGILKRGFPAPDPEGGVHAHALRRSRKSTAKDGRHIHIFLIDGRMVATEEDGEHEHVLPDGKDRSATDGVHRHTVMLPKGDDAQTEEAGEHNHDLMVFTTGFDGSHVHVLVLPDDRRLRSLTPREFVDLVPQAARTDAGAIETATQVLKS